jgi:predicted DNA repair protein MutK
MVFIYGVILVIVGAVVLLINGSFFAFKMMSSRNSYHSIDSEKHHHHHHHDDDSVELSNLEAMCFMGLIWTSCIHDGRMSKTAFKSWGAFSLTLAVIFIIVGVSLYFCNSRFCKIQM